MNAAASTHHTTSTTRATLEAMPHIFCGAVVVGRGRGHVELRAVERHDPRNTSVADNSAHRRHFARKVCLHRHMHGIVRPRCRGHDLFGIRRSTDGREDIRIGERVEPVDAQRALDVDCCSAVVDRSGDRHVVQRPARPVDRSKESGCLLRILERMRQLHFQSAISGGSRLTDRPPRRLRRRRTADPPPTRVLA